MNRKLAEGVFHVGVVDWNVRDFHGYILWIKIYNYEFDHILINLGFESYNRRVIITIHFKKI